MLKYQWSFIHNFSWFVITLITYSSVCDTIGRYVAGLRDFLPKRYFLTSSLIRGIFFIAIFMMVFEGVYHTVVGSDWFMILVIGCFLSTSGYWTTIGPVWNRWADI